MYRLSVCAGTLLQDLPFVERLQKIAGAGFLVDLWGWEEDAIDTIAADSRIEISAMPGWIGGSMVHPEGIETYMEGVKKNLEIARRFNCRNLCITTGALDDKGQMAHPIAGHPATRWISAYKTLCQVAELAEKHDVVYHLEQLNTKVDHAGYPLPHTADVVHLLHEVGSPRLRLLCDIYHVQSQEGNVIQTLRDYYHYIGNIHVADVPGRHEPGTGEINYPEIVRVLHELKYQGVVGMEAFPKNDDMEAMVRFRTLFSA
jgi:hydroxypyruvate isomerase